MDNIRCTNELLNFLSSSPTAFHAVDEMGKILLENGFIKLFEGDKWNLVKGGKYFVTRNMSSIIAFAIPENDASSFAITASHTDSPALKLKPTCEVDTFGKYVRLSVEVYGSMIFSSWMDRPLSIAGRVIVRENNKLVTKLVNLDRDLLLIPNTSIHQNRTINNGYAYNPAIDMLPLFSSYNNKKCVKEMVADELSCSADDIVSSELSVYVRTSGTVWGANNEYFSSPRIDDLHCAYATFKGFLNSVVKNEFATIPVFTSFDNEETGNQTKQGAASGFMHDILSRICVACGINLDETLPSSFMVSADNSHAKHPNHPELYDSNNVPYINEGVVIKVNTTQRYTTDAVASALFSEICKKAGVPVQFFANKSDLAGGATLGSLANTKVALSTVDIGLAQLSMHSAYESAGCEDTLHLINAVEALYKTKIRSTGDGVYEIK